MGDSTAENQFIQIFILDIIWKFEDDLEEGVMLLNYSIGFWTLFIRTISFQLLNSMKEKLF